MSTPGKQAYHVSLPFFVAAIVLLAPLQFVALVALVHIAEHVRKLRDTGCTILMSLHGESEMARLATRAIRLEGGGMIADTQRGAMFQSIFAAAGC